MVTAILSLDGCCHGGIPILHLADGEDGHQLLTQHVGMIRAVGEDHGQLQVHGLVHVHAGGLENHVGVLAHEFLVRHQLAVCIRGNAQVNDLLGLFLGEDAGAAVLHGLDELVIDALDNREDLRPARQPVQPGQHLQKDDHHHPQRWGRAAANQVRL